MSGLDTEFGTEFQQEYEMPREHYSHYLTTNSQCHTACCVPGEFPSVKAAREASMLEFLKRRHQRNRTPIERIQEFEWKLVEGMMQRNLVVIDHKPMDSFVLLTT